MPVRTGRVLRTVVRSLGIGVVMVGMGSLRALSGQNGIFWKGYKELSGSCQNE